MSLSNPHLTPIPSSEGQPVSVEPIEGTGKLRITRRFVCPVQYVTSADLVKVVAPYGTADSAPWANGRTPEARRVWADAFLVDLRIVPAPAAGGKESATERWIEEVYEQTPYVRADNVNRDALGVIVRRVRDVVLSVGQDIGALYPPVAGYVRTMEAVSEDAGRRVWRITDATGDGLLSEDRDDAGDSVFVTTRRAHTTEPAPAAGDIAFSKIKRDGYWESVTRRRLSNAEAGITTRARRNITSRQDGSLEETASSVETVPSTSLSGTVYLVESGTADQAGNVAAHSRRWIKPPADWNYTDNVPWTYPGVVSLTGGAAAVLSISAPQPMVLAGAIAYSYGTSKTPDAIWQVTSACAWKVTAKFKPDEANGIPGAMLTEVRSAPNCVGEFAQAGGTSYNGAPVSLLLITGASTPSGPPSGATLIDSRVTPYLVALDGTRVFEKRNTTVTV